jgi:diguanylate cyclase (GGDEF)-like protein
VIAAVHIWAPGLSGAAVLAVLLLFCFQSRRRTRRERWLEGAVRQRTIELERERSREKSRNRILEMLVTNQPLGVVLDHVAQLIRAEAPEVVCAFALRHGDRCHVASAPGASPGMLAALQNAHAIPFEVWRGWTDFRTPASDPAWKIFIDGLKEPAPAVIRTRLIGTPEVPQGACLIFDKSNPPCPINPDIVEQGARLAQLAIEHARFCEDLNFQAHHDGLTGLPNRALFELRLNEAVAEAGRTRRKLAVLFVDLDRLKQINDTMSHRVGDLFLVETAARMRRVVSVDDLVARIGGDEFNILLGNISETAEAEALANRILEAVREPIMIEGRSVVASASIGIAVFPDDGTEAEDLRREADAAMYCAKEMGRNRVQAFSEQNETLDSARMDRELKNALRDRLFQVHYQPKVDARGRFKGMEALLRLHHPVHGNIPPNKFIPMAEESGLIVSLGAWVLDEVCRQIALWRATGMGQVPVAVNVSPVQICRPDFASEVEESLRRHLVSPHCLELELTESLLIGSGEETQKQMNHLRSLGIRFSIDDFGTGYSSLSYLHRLRVDAIKLDRSFVQSIDSDEAARRLVQAMIGVAEGLGLGVIAEGVETEEQRQVLIAAGCPQMQGYLFSRPRPPAELENYLRAAASNTDDLLRLETACSVPARTAPAFQSV